VYGRGLGDLVSGWTAKELNCRKSGGEWGSCLGGWGKDEGHADRNTRKGRITKPRKVPANGV